MLEVILLLPSLSLLAYIQWLKYKSLSKFGRKSTDILDNVVFVKVEALEPSQQRNLETQASLT